MPLRHHPIDRADVVRVDHKRVPHSHILQRHLHNVRFPFSVGDGRHAFGQRREHGGGAAQGITLQRLPTGEHEDDDRSGQVFAQ